MSDTPPVKLGFAKIEHEIIDNLKKIARDATMDLLSVKKDLFQAQSELSASQTREAELREKLGTALSANSILSEELQATEAALKLSAAKYNQDAGVTEFVAVKAKELTEHWKQRAEAAEARIKESQDQETALKRYEEFTSGGDSIDDPVEALRFFCSLCMKTPQDWLDIERFFDAVIAERAELRKLLEESKVPEDVRSFIYRVTLHLQSFRSKTPEQIVAMFQEAYVLYGKYDVEGRNVPQPPKEQP